jgi:hypothetical protein
MPSLMAADVAASFGFMAYALASCVDPLLRIASRAR